MKGLIHIYCGDGKGKTTAAMGLALRMAGNGKKVLIYQFLKDGSSGEIELLKKSENITVESQEQSFGFTFCMDEEKRKEAKAYYSGKFRKVVSMAESGRYDLLVLDEFMAAYKEQMISKDEAMAFLENKPGFLEVALTGREPEERLLALADYVTEMKKQKHPFDKGITAREGIEY